MSERASAVIVMGLATLIVTGCGATGDNPYPTSPSTTNALPSRDLSPVEPTPLTTVWSASPDIDLDSRPAQIVRGFEDSSLYVNARVGLEDGYKGAREFMGDVRNLRTPAGLPPLSGTSHAALIEMTATPDSVGTRYRATVCTSLLRATEWRPGEQRWVRAAGEVTYYLEFSIPGPELPTRSGEGTDQLDVANRTQHPEYDVFEGAILWSDPEWLELVSPEDRSRTIDEECDRYLPSVDPHSPIDGPLPADPWYPGWLRNSD